VAAALTVLKVKSAFVYEVTVVVRVTESKVSQAGSTLGRGNLRAYVNEIALTNARLLELMAKHAKAFPRVKTDPVFAVQDFRENIKVEIAENDFVEERSSSDPPRSARLLITVNNGDPELTWQIAQELADLVAGSTIAVQRASLKADLQGAMDAAANAAREANAIEEQKIVGPNIQLDMARQRLLAAQQKVQDVTLALRALEQQQGVRFEISERGKVPRRVNRAEVGTKAFVTWLLLGLVGGWMLAGAFDPRVLDEADVTDVGMPILGRLRTAPRSVVSVEEDGDAPAGSSRDPDSRV
jgi:hypothetical protein